MDDLEYVKLMKDIQANLLTFIESDNDINIDFDNLIHFLEEIKILEILYGLKEMLMLLYKISKNHQRNQNFFDKIQKIILYFQEDIKKTFSNYDLFHFFKKSKIILLILFENEIMIPTPDIYNFIKKQSDKHTFDIENKYIYYFYPEINMFVNDDSREYIKRKLLNIDENILNNFEEKRRIGQNNSHVCELIRNDSIEEFVSYVNQNGISVQKAKIKPSLFETNRFLIKKKTTFIEYAAFFGSIQIFQYIKLNSNYIDSSLWLYAIHSKSQEMFHLMEENQSDKTIDFCVVLYSEAIKCHHNDIADYIQDNLLTEIDKDNTNLITEIIYRYHNYNYFPNKTDQNSLKYFCLYEYFELVSIFCLISKASSAPNLISTIIIFLIKFQLNLI